MRPIDADALVRLLYDAEGTAPILGLSRIIEISDVVRIIEDAPTIGTVPVRRGRWERQELAPSSCLFCSECGFPKKRGTWNFCPNCGADMREGKKNG